MPSVSEPSTVEEAAEALAAAARSGERVSIEREGGEVPGPYRQHPLEAAGLAERF